MPTLDLHFKLPEEQHEADLALDAAKWYLGVYDIVNELRNRLKYGNAGAEIEDFNKWVWEMLADRQINPYDE